MFDVRLEVVLVSALEVLFEFFKIEFLTPNDADKVGTGRTSFSPSICHYNLDKNLSLFNLPFIFDKIR